MKRKAYEIVCPFCHKRTMPRRTLLSAMRAMKSHICWSTLARGGGHRRQKPVEFKA